MKTFLLNIPQRLKLKSQELDAQAALCDKPWTVFNDEGIKQLFIFQPDGSLLITTNGIVSCSTWQFISANKSIIITTDNKSIMFHPAFLDDVVFALQQDGDGANLFMIDENNTRSFLPKTLTELSAYFSNKEQILIEAEQRSAELERLRIDAARREEEEKRENERKEEEMKRKEEEERIKAEELFSQRRDAIKKEFAVELEEIYIKTEKRRRIKHIGLGMLILSLLLFCFGGFSQLSVLVAIGGCLFFLSLPFLVFGDVDPEKEINLFIERKLQEEGWIPKVISDNSKPPLYL